MEYATINHTFTNQVLVSGKSWVEVRPRDGFFDYTEATEVLLWALPKEVLKLWMNKVATSLKSSGKDLTTKSWLFSLNGERATLANNRIDHYRRDCKDGFGLKADDWRREARFNWDGKTIVLPASEIENLYFFLLTSDLDDFDAAEVSEAIEREAELNEIKKDLDYFIRAYWAHIKDLEEAEFRVELSTIEVAELKSDLKVVKSKAGNETLTVALEYEESKLARATEEVEKYGEWVKEDAEELPKALAEALNKFDNDLVLEVCKEKGWEELALSLINETAEETVEEIVEETADKIEVEVREAAYTITIEEKQYGKRLPEEILTEVEKLLPQVQGLYKNHDLVQVRPYFEDRSAFEVVVVGNVQVSKYECRKTRHAEGFPPEKLEGLMEVLIRWIDAEIAHGNTNHYLEATAAQREMAEMEVEEIAEMRYIDYKITFVEEQQGKRLPAEVQQEVEKLFPNERRLFNKFNCVMIEADDYNDDLFKVTLFAGVRTVRENVFNKSEVEVLMAALVKNIKAETAAGNEYHYLEKKRKAVAQEKTVRVKVADYSMHCLEKLSGKVLPADLKTEVEKLFPEKSEALFDEIEAVTLKEYSWDEDVYRLTVKFQSFHPWVEEFSRDQIKGLTFTLINNIKKEIGAGNKRHTLEVA